VDVQMDVICRTYACFREVVTAHMNRPYIIVSDSERV